MNLAAWANFAVAAVSISGALAGLIFVGLSFNMDFILSNGHLPARAGTALATLLSVGVLNLCLLVPGQGRLPLTIETFVLAGVLITSTVATALATLRRRRPGDPWAWVFQPVAINIVTPLVLIAAGLAILTHSNLTLVAVATIAGVVASVWEAWVLLIEIRR